MIRALLERLHPKRLFAPKAKPKTIKLEIIAEQIQEFKESKKQLDGRINVLEEKTHHMEETVTQTLEISSANQQRLSSIEGNLERMVAITHDLVTRQGLPPTAETPKQQQTANTSSTQTTPQPTQQTTTPEATPETALSEETTQADETTADHQNDRQEEPTEPLTVELAPGQKTPATQSEDRQTDDADSGKNVAEAAT